jgi:Tfp pilus assembly protein PilN
MKRINHLVTPSERWFGVDLASLVPPALRAPLAVLGCAIALLVLVGAAEQLRLRAAERDGAEYARTLAAAELDVAAVRAVAADVTRLRALNAQADEIRRSGPEHAAVIAALGNRVPAGAWFTSLRAGRATLAIEGGGDRLATVAALLPRLAQVAPYADARLLAVHEDPVRAGLTYALELEARR